MREHKFDGKDCIHIRGLKLWAHVGVLPHERDIGQWFELNLTIRLSLNNPGKTDLLMTSCDYSLAIKSLQLLSQKLTCFTIEAFTEHCLERLEELYGPLPMRIEIIKCNAPVSGFSGEVSIERYRRWV